MSVETENTKKHNNKKHNNKKRNRVEKAVVDAPVDASTAQLAQDLHKNPNSKIQLFALRLVPSDHPSYDVPAGSVLRISNLAIDAKNTVINASEPATSLLLTVVNTPIQKFTIGSVSAANAGSTVVDFYVPGPAKVLFEVQGNQVICVNGFQLTNVAPGEFVERAAKRQKTEDKKEDVDMLIADYVAEEGLEQSSAPEASSDVAESAPAVAESAAPVVEAETPAPEVTGKKNKKNKNKNNKQKAAQAEEPKPVVEETQAAVVVEDSKDVEMTEEPTPVAAAPATPEAPKKEEDKKSNKKNKKNKNKQQKDGEPSPVQAPVVPETPAVPAIAKEEVKESAPVTPQPTQSSKKNKKQKNKKEGEPSPATAAAPVQETQKVEVTPEGKTSKKPSTSEEKKPSSTQQQPGEAAAVDSKSLAKAKQHTAAVMKLLKNRSRSMSAEGRKPVRA